MNETSTTNESEANCWICWIQIFITFMYEYMYVMYLCHVIGCLGVQKHKPDPQELLLQVLVKSQMWVAMEEQHVLLNRTMSLGLAC